jgi:site-specific recombinase XerD
MPIKEVSKYNYKEICNELKIDYDEFLSFISSNGESNVSLTRSKHTKAIEVIESFANSLLIQDIRKIKSKNTIKYYLSFLHRFILFLKKNYENIPFEDLNEEIIYRFIDETNKNISCDNNNISKSSLSQSSLNTYVAIIKRICTYATEKGYLDKNIGFKFRKIKISYLPRYFTKAQLRKIFEEVDKRRCSLLWRTIFITLLGTGLRVNEVAKLKIRDIDFDNLLIYTLGKGNKERYVPLYPAVKNSILLYLKTTGVEDLEEHNGFLFSRDTKRLKPVSDRSIQYNLMKIRRDLKLDFKYTVHSFRHTFAVNCLKANMHIMYLSQILGHESPSTTAIYTKLLPKDLQQEITEKYPIPFEGLIKEIITGNE